MRLSAPVFRLERNAKLLARDHKIPLHETLDCVANAEGFQSWSHLATSAKRRPAEQIFHHLTSGDLLLLGARPGHGKTLMGLEIAATASAHGCAAHIYTLGYNSSDILNRFTALGLKTENLAQSITLNTSDEICANYIIDQLADSSGETLVVIDCLQHLDQKRSTPGLDAQIRALKSFAKASGTIFVFISQIDRTFDLTGKRLPDLADIRLPNPLDLTLFNKTCFLHDGDMQIAT
jgi:replicative DNA helicase